MAFTKGTTPSRNQLKEQLSAILAATKSNGYKLEEIMSEDVKDQFGGLIELKAARTYIKEVEAREKELQTANDKLTAELEEKQQEIECQPGAFEYLKVDVKQLNHQIEYYKELAEDAQDRAGRYQIRLREAIDKQKYDDEAATKTKHLEVVIQDHRAQIAKLLDENHAAATLYDDMDLSHKQTLAMKDEEIVRLIAKMENIETEKSEMDEITEACSSLIDTLESETNLTAIQLNHHSLAMQRNEKQVSAAVSELLPLNRFYDRAFTILHIYRLVFQRLADPRAISIASLPMQELNMLFRAASEDMYQYREVHALMQVEGLAQDAMRMQVEMLADHAARLHGSLSAMRDDTVGFLGRITREPSVWRAMKARFG